MDDNGQPPLVGLAILFIFSIYSAISETSLASVPKNRVKLHAERGDSRAEKTLCLLDNFDRTVTSLLIITNICHLAFASIVTVWVTGRWGLSAVSISTALCTVAVFFFCEMLPKSVAKKYSFRLSLACSPLLCFLVKILSPLSTALTFLAGLFSSHLKEDADVSVTENELQDLIEDMTQEGSISEEEGDLISSALEFGDVTAQSILTPRVDIQAINIQDRPEDIFNFIKKQTHSRLPVYQGTIDNITGVVGIRKYMKYFLKHNTLPDISSITDKVYYAHQSTEIHELLSAMSKNKFTLAVITDNYGGTLGIVTIEDILEELVGDIWDESDIVREPVIRREDGTFLADAECSLSDVFEAMKYDDTNQEADDANLLLGQWCYEHFNKIPEKGQSFDYGNLNVTVNKIEHNRIVQVLLRIK